MWAKITHDCGLVVSDSLRTVCLHLILHSLSSSTDLSAIILIVLKSLINMNSTDAWSMYLHLNSFKQILIKERSKKVWVLDLGFCLFVFLINSMLIGINYILKFLHFIRESCISFSVVLFMLCMFIQLCICTCMHAILSLHSITSLWLVCRSEVKILPKSLCIILF